MKKRSRSYDVVVCGGGLAGFCAAIAAARHGANTCLVQDRPVLGGNSSSEVRVTPHGAAAFHSYARETGIISEALIEERARNHEPIMENGWTNSIWDIVLYDLAMTTPNLTLLVNTSVTAIIMDGDSIPKVSTPEPAFSLGYYHRPACNPTRKVKAVICRVANAEVEMIIEGEMFIDCTGDGVVADLAGCEWRMGSESKNEFGEIHAVDQANTETMGNSIHIKARDMGRPIPFKAPDWAVKYDNADFFYKQGRIPYDPKGGYWWIEIGVPWHTIHEAEDIRHELTKHALGIWDWIKNRDPHMKAKGIERYALDWIGQTPGKRESRRIIGCYFMTEHDVQNKTVFPDEIAFGGWFVDLHTPGGLLADKSEPASAEGYKPTSDYAAKSYCGPYGIPLRILISKDIDNLMMAGRNVSVTHAALGTVRVMATTALMGQAAGTSAAVALRQGIDLPKVPEFAIKEIQQILLRDGCFLPNYKNEDKADIARTAKVTASSEARFYGAGPAGEWKHGGIEGWRRKTKTGDALQNRRGQWIGIGTDRLDTISVCLSNSSNEVKQVEVVLVPVDHIWDYRSEPGEPIAKSTLLVPPGQKQWIDWSCNVKVTPGKYVRLDLLPNSDVIWHTSPVFEPGHMAAFEMAPGKMRRFDNGVTCCIKVTPPQPCFPAENVLSGETRPHRYTNLWRSDPAQPLPQYLELTWPAPQAIKQVELTFPGHLLCEYHAYQPLSRDPQCPKGYMISAFINGAWQKLLEVRDNYQRLRKHLFDTSLSTSSLRITILETNGDPSAAIYEVRCY